VVLFLKYFLNIADKFLYLYKIMSSNVEEYVKPAIEHVFRTMLNTNLIYYGDNPPNGQMEKAEDVRIASSIGCTGAFTGLVCLTVGDQLAVAITRRLLGMSASEEVNTEYVTDAIGELSNMIAGYVKTKLCDNKAPTTMSVPAVVRGKNLNVCCGSNTKCSSLEFVCGRKPVLIQVITIVNATKSNA